MKKFFNAVRPGSKIGDGTVGDLVDWLEKLVNVILPDNAIEYWSNHQYSGPQALKRYQQVPSTGADDDNIHHIASYVRSGTSEGHIVEVGFYLRNGTMKFLTWAKAFGKEDDAWLIARLVGSALNSILLWEEVPEIVDMSDKLPRSCGWHRTTSLTEEVTIAASSRQLTVATASGLVLDHRDWSEKGDNAKFAVEAHLLDWKTVLTNLQARFAETNERREVFPDLPGYVFTDRGVSECTGVYVLPPGGRPNDDRDWLGFFPTIDTAVAAATVHQRSTPALKAA